MKHIIFGIVLAAGIGFFMGILYGEKKYEEKQQWFCNKTHIYCVPFDDVYALFDSAHHIFWTKYYKDTTFPAFPNQVLAWKREVPGDSLLYYEGMRSGLWKAFHPTYIKILKAQE